MAPTRRNREPQTQSGFYVNVSDSVNGSVVAVPTGGTNIQTGSGIQNIKFTKFDGGTEVVASSTFNDGVTGRDLPLTGNLSVEPVTLTKPYIPEEDVVIYQWFERLKKAQPGISAAITPIYEVVGSDEPEVKTNLQIVFTGCKILSVSTPSVDRGSSEATNLEVKLQPTFRMTPTQASGGTGA